MPAQLHLVKLCVGADAVEDLAAWQAKVVEANRAAGRAAVPTHVTRMWPRRAPEIRGSGSLYWVFRGLVLCRQPIRDFEPRLGADGIERCAIVLAPDLVRTHPQPRRPFQGWRYLAASDAPADLGEGAGSDLPPGLAADLATIGVL